MNKELIQLIELFKTKESKLYWIEALNESKSIKGSLIIYFNLL